MAKRLALYDRFEKPQPALDASQLAKRFDAVSAEHADLKRRLREAEKSQQLDALTELNSKLLRQLNTAELLQGKGAKSWPRS
jgi:hypothetical protein